MRRPSGWRVLLLLHRGPDGFGRLFAPAHVQGHVDGVVVDEFGAFQNAGLGGGWGSGLALEVLPEQVEELEVRFGVGGVGHFAEVGAGGMDEMGRTEGPEGVR